MNRPLADENGRSIIRISFELVSSSIDAAVSSSALACCSVRADRSALPEAISCDAWVIVSVLPGMLAMGLATALFCAARLPQPIYDVELVAKAIHQLSPRARHPMVTVHRAARVELTTNAQRARAQEFYRELGFVASHVGMKYYLGGRS